MGLFFYAAESGYHTNILKNEQNSLTYANGESTSYAYNLANKLKTLYNKKGSTVLSSYEYTYYLNGNQASKTDTTGLTTYAYDGLGRLATVSEPGSVATAYQYDDYNNRNKMVVTGGTSPCAITYGYDSLNRLKTEINSVSGTTNYRYDDNGNQISKNNDNYKYDAFNQMTGFTSGTNTAAYTYNADGLRTGKTVNGVTTSHTWDGDQIVLDFSGSNVTGKYTRGINLIAEDIGGVRKFALFNGHGDLTGLCDASGNLLKSYDYDAFGNEKSPDANDTNPFRYCGEYFDKETGDVYLRARYYNPTDGRFVSEDSVLGKDTDPLSLNLYTYCGNDPVDAWDPTGHINYWTQSWLLAGGYAQRGYEIASPFSNPTSYFSNPIDTVKQGYAFWSTAASLGKSLYSGDMSWGDLAQVLGDKASDALIGDLMYLKNNYNQFNSNTNISNDQARELGRRTSGAIYQLAQLGYTAASLSSALKEVALGKAVYAAEGSNPLNIPTYINNPGKFVSWLRQFEKAKVPLTKAQADELVRVANQFGVKVEASTNDLAGHTGEAGINWGVPHIHVGDARIHIPVPKGYTLK